MARAKKKAILTLRERCDLLHGIGCWHLSGVPRLKIPPFEMHDGPCGLRHVEEKAGLNLDATFQSICYPAPCLTACSFDTSLIEEIGQSIGKECQFHSTNMILAPGVNIKRNPLCGRNFEYYSEDPLLSGKMGAAFIRGSQSVHVGACLKHFACNSQESYRMINDSIVDERALHEIYLKPFEIAIKEANPWAVMASYNKINGDYASDSDYLLKHVLRNKWKYNGVTMSDWGGTNDSIESHNHGLDVEMPCFYGSRTFELMNAYRVKRISASVLEESSTRVLEMCRKATYGVKHPAPFNMEAGHSLAVRAAEQSMVLLKNDGVLPLLNLDDCCVIGDLARIMRYQGGGSSHVKPYHLPSFVDVINDGANNMVPFASGYYLDPNEDDHRAMMDAVDLASRCGTAIVFVGLPEIAESEGFDRENMLLPEDQLSLLEAVADVNSNMIVVLCTGSPVELPFLNKCKALLLAYLGGEGAAEAILHILKGEVSPSGHLAETWPIHLMDVPNFGFYPGYADFSLYKESIYVGYRYYISCDKRVNFPFGYGLSYAKFESHLTLSKNALKQGETLTARVSVKNVSATPGHYVIQLYAQSKLGDVFKPLRTLIAFSKVFLKKGESKIVEFELGMDTFAHYDVNTHHFQTESDTYLVELASDCQTVIESQPVAVKGREFESRKVQIPVYYNVPKDGFLLYDEDFEDLLGHPFPVQKDRRSRPFNLNSTMGDISWTWIGKRTARAYLKGVGLPANDPAAKMYHASFYGMPIRNISMGGKKLSSPRIAYAFLSAANGKFLQALLRLIFGVRRPKR